MAVKCASIVTVFFALIVDKHAAHVADLSCNFDFDLCNWRQNVSGWTLETHATYLEPGPVSDHSTGDGNYLHVKGDGRRKTTVLISDYQKEGSYCLNFWYNLHGWGITLRVIATTNLTEEQYFQKTGSSQSHDWVGVKVGMTSTSSFQVEIIGEIFWGSSGEISVDDIQFIPGLCSPDCDFDTDTCGWEARPPVWYIDNGKVNSDHTTGAGNFIEVKNPYTYLTYNTAYRSPLVEPGDYCFSFWFRVFSNNYALSVALTVTGEIFRNPQEKPGYFLLGQWNPAHFKIRSPQSFKIDIRVILGERQKLDVDDIKLCHGMCDNDSEVIDCSFGSGLCSWNQDEGDDFDWSRKIGGLDRSTKTPVLDHATQVGNYIYVSPEQRGKAAITSLMQAPGTYCFSMWYYMNGDGTRQLVVRSQTYEMSQQLSMKSNNQGDEWRHIQIQISSAYSFKLMIEAYMGYSSAGGIAVDDIQMCAGLCKRDLTFVEVYQPLALSNEEDIDLADAGVFVNDTTAVIFEVKCHSDALIVLQENSDTTIQVVIGGQENATSVIRTTKAEGKYASYMESNIVTASAYRAFWISWDDDVVRVGKGFIPSQKEFMRLNESHYNIESLSVQKNVYSDVYWRFYLDKFPRTTTTSAPTSTVSHSATSTRSTGTEVRSFSTPLTTLSNTTLGASTASNAEDSSNHSDFDEKHKKQLSDKMSVSENGSLVAVVVATSCAVIIGVAIVLYLVWRKRDGTGIIQCLKSKPEKGETTTSVENNAYSDATSVRFENRSAVNASLQNCNGAEYINLGFEARTNVSEYNHIKWNTEPTEEPHTCPQIGNQQPEATNSEYSYLQHFNQGLKDMTYAHTNEIKFKQNGSVHQNATEETYNAISSGAQNNMKIKTVLKQDEDSIYNRSSGRMAEKKLNGEDEYSHLNEVTKPGLEKNLYAIPNKKVPEQKMQSQKSNEERDRQHCVSAKPADPNDKGVPSDTEDHDYSILEKIEH